MNKVTKDTPHGPVELRADNDNALAYVMTAVTVAHGENPLANVVISLVTALQAIEETKGMSAATHLRAIARKAIDGAKAK